MTANEIFFLLSLLLAFAVGYLFPRDQVRRLRERLYLAERAENDSRREVRILHSKLSETQTKLDQADHELRTRTTSSQDQARLGALLHELAAILGVREEPFGGIAEVEILTAAKTAARFCSEIDETKP